MMSSVQEVFDQWALRDGGVPMGREHWPRVSQVLSELPESAGNYLEIGPGNGYALQYMAEKKFSDGQCYAIELSPEMASSCRRRTQHLANVTVDVGEYIEWPRKSLKFDIIFSMEVFYYLKDMKKNIALAASMLSEGGQLIVMVDFFAENEDSLHWPDELGLELTRWSSEQYATAFAEAGLTHVRHTEIYGGDFEQGRSLCVRGIKVVHSL